MEVRFNTQGKCVCSSCGYVVYESFDDVMDQDWNEDSLRRTCECGKELNIVTQSRSLIGELRQALISSDCKESHKMPSILAINPPENTVRDLDMSILRVGMVVDAQYFVKKKSYGWYRGIISKIHPSSRGFDVEYDDGGFQQKVPRSHIRVLGNEFVTAGRNIELTCQYGTTSMEDDTKSKSSDDLTEMTEATEVTDSLTEAQTSNTCLDLDSVREQLHFAAEIASKTAYICKVVQDLHTAHMLIDSFQPRKEIIELSDTDEIINISDDDEPGSMTCPIVCD